MHCGRYERSWPNLLQAGFFSHLPQCADTQILFSGLLSLGQIPNAIAEYAKYICQFGILTQQQRPCGGHVDRRQLRIEVAYGAGWQLICPPRLRSSTDYARHAIGFHDPHGVEPKPLSRFQPAQQNRAMFVPLFGGTVVEQ